MYDPSMRVLTVLELLQAHERISGQELADALEVSVRTVQRYVMRLQDLGVPVESSRGPGGAYMLARGYRLPPLMLGAEEGFAIALGLDALTHLGLSEIAPAAIGARTKLARMLPLGLGERVDAVRSTLMLEEPRVVKATDVSHLITLVAAATAQQCVEIVYRDDMGEVTERTIEPYGVLQYEGRWLLAAFCQLRDDMRLFRVDRVEETVTTAKPFERPDDFDLRGFVYNRLATAEADWYVEVWLDRPLDEVRMRLPRALGVLSDEAGGTRIECTSSNLEWLAMLLLPLSSNLEIRRPNELRDAFRAVAARAAAIAENEVVGMIAAD
jgi:predicted DNA-binding transcriptional regulator YafY